MSTSIRRAVSRKATAVVVLAVMLLADVAAASVVSASVVDVDNPVGAVSLAPGASGNITINLSVTGNQEGSATFKVYRNWVLSGGIFAGSNPQTFSVAPRDSRDPATLFSTTGTVSVGAGHALGGPHTLAVGAFEITNSNTSGGKLGGGSLSNYAITVVAPSDTSPPVLTPTVTGTKGSNDWYTTDVTVSWMVTDAQSTAVIDSGCTTDTFTTDTTAATSSCTAHSAGGSATNSLTVKIDKTAPTNVSLAPSGTEGTSGWYTSNVTVATSGSDTTSGVSCTADQAFIDETAGQVVNGSCTNGAGLTTHAVPLTIRIDKSGPSASLAVTSGDLGANGWYRSNVTVTAAGSDSISGPVVCSESVNLVNETVGTVVNGSCTNGAGLTTNAAPITVKIDKTNPSAALAPSGTLGNNGWYTSNVTVATLGSDTVSDPVTCSDVQSFTANTTAQAVNGSCTNDAGLTQNAESITIKIDKTPPTDVALSILSGSAGENGCSTRPRRPMLPSSAVSATAQASTSVVSRPLRPARRPMPLRGSTSAPSAGTPLLWERTR